MERTKGLKGCFVACRLTKAQQANCQAWICTRCGTSTHYRNTAGQCGDCHNKGCGERKALRKAQIEAQREKGRAYWQSRGIAVGEKVYTFARSMLGFGGMEVVGIAKVGACGAYVASKCQKGTLNPDTFHKKG